MEIEEDAFVKYPFWGLLGSNRVVYEMHVFIYACLSVCTHSIDFHKGPNKMCQLATQTLLYIIQWSGRLVRPQAEHV